MSIVTTSAQLIRRAPPAAGRQVTTPLVSETNLPVTRSPFFNWTWSANPGRAVKRRIVEARMVNRIIVGKSSHHPTLIGERSLWYAQGFRASGNNSVVECDL